MKFDRLRLGVELILATVAFAMFVVTHNTVYFYTGVALLWTYVVINIIWSVIILFAYRRVRNNKIVSNERSKYWKILNHILRGKSSILTLILLPVLVVWPIFFDQLFVGVMVALSALSLSQLLDYMSGQVEKINSQPRYLVDHDGVTWLGQYEEYDLYAKRAGDKVVLLGQLSSWPSDFITINLTDVAKLGTLPRWVKVGMSRAIENGIQL